MKNFFIVFLAIFFAVSCSDSSNKTNDDELVNDIDQISTTDNDLTDTDQPDETNDEVGDNEKDDESSDADQETQGGEGQVTSELNSQPQTMTPF